MSLPPPEPPLYIPNLPPPFINIPSLPNLRDAGGYTSTLPNGTTAPSSVRKKLLYRSGDPSRISSQDLQKLYQDLGITTIFDIRSWPEIEKAGTLPQWEETLKENGKVERRWAPVFATEDYSPDKVAARFQEYGSWDGTQGFVNAYAQILENAGPTLKEVFAHLASPAAENGAVLVHCSAGKDRAGVVVAVVLSVLGVLDEVIAEEYALTDVGMGPMKEYFVERVLEGGTFGEGEVARQRALKMVTARKENMAATLAMLRRRWGEPEEYVKSVAGIDDGLIEAVRRNALVSATGSSRALNEI